MRKNLRTANSFKMQEHADNRKKMDRYIDDLPECIDLSEEMKSLILEEKAPMMLFAMQEC